VWESTGRVFEVELTVADSTSDRVADSRNNRTRNNPNDVKKTKLKPHIKKQWCIPPKQNGEFAAKMEDILEVYALAYDEQTPLICMDERPVQLLGEKLEPLPVKPGKAAKEDYEYVRGGICNIFIFTEPLTGWRHVHASERRTKVDWALHIQELLDVYYPKAKKIRLVSDNLNTHNISSLYETFDPQTALKLAKRLEIHHTPKHGSWLNIAEIELSVLTMQCLGRRISDIGFLQSELSAWESQRNDSQKSVDWHFSTSDARDKLKFLYPIPKF
jgi:hypothetical protein